MDQIFDRLGKLFRSWTVPGEDSEDVRQQAASGDPDLKAAEEELDEFLKTGRNEKRHGPTQGSHSYHYQKSNQQASREDIELQKAYLTLDLSPGASWETINNQHKKLLLKHHPDRHGGNPKAQAEATQRTQRINEAYQRLKKHLGR